MFFTDRKAALRRWKLAEDFYSERDNRTELEVKDLAHYAKREVVISVDPHEAHLPTVQRIALLACNLTARWARSVRIVVPDVRLHPDLIRDGFTSLGERIIAEMRAADPFGDFRFERLETYIYSHVVPPLRLFIGPWHQYIPASDSGDVDGYFVHAASWTALGRRGKGFDINVAAAPHATVAAAGLAASIGVADLFKRAIGHPKEYWIPDFSWCTWSHTLSRTPRVQMSVPAVSATLDFGNTLLAGVGAIGSAFLYLADLMPLRGELTMLDRDKVETSNLNRSPLFQVRHVLDDLEKTLAAKNYVARQGLKVTTLTGTWHEHGARLSETPFDVWISMTNEDGAWAEVPYLLPPIVLHGTTTSGWGMGAGRHIPRVEDCTMCRLPRPAAVFRGPCAEGNINPDELKPTVQASLPFLSSGAAALLLADFLKLGSNSLTKLPNEVAVDFRYGLPAVIALTRLSNENCRGCNASKSKLWPQRGGRGRYSNYSLAA
jgi:ThiF family